MSEQAVARAENRLRVQPCRLRFRELTERVRQEVEQGWGV